MTYSTGNPPVRIVDSMPTVGPIGSTFIGSTVLSFLKGGLGIWAYRSTHSSSEIIAPNFFTYAESLGMKIGDFLINQPQTTSASSKATIHWVTNLTSQTTGTVNNSTWGWRYDATVASAT